MRQESEGAALEATAAGAVDTLLARAVDIAAALRDGDHGPVDRATAERLLSDLALVQRLLRSLNTVAADRLERAEADLQEAGEQLGRSLDAAQRP